MRVESILGCAMMYTPPGAMDAPATKSRQYSWVPGVDGALDTLASA